MQPLNRILAATDLSDPARHAAERAALISKETTVPLDLFHVANLAPLERLQQLMGVTPADMEQRVLNAARQGLEDLATSLQARHDVVADIHVTVGSLPAALIRHTNERAADLLVCGARGESVLRHLLLGTTALRVLGSTTCPVLVVKQAPERPYRRLLIPVDFSPASLRAIRHARRIAPRADIVLLHTFEVPFEGHLRYASVDDETIHRYRIIARQEATQKLHALRDEAGLPSADCTLMVMHGDPASRIIEQTHEQNCDLIAMGKRGERTIQELLLGSVTKHVLTEVLSDVLVSV